MLNFFEIWLSTLPSLPPLVSEVATLRRCFPAARVVALGGATEATVWSNSFEVAKIHPCWRSVPYGRPIWNHQSLGELDVQLRFFRDHSCPLNAKTAGSADFRFNAMNRHVSTTRPCIRRAASATFGAIICIAALLVQP